MDFRAAPSRGGPIGLALLAAAFAVEMVLLAAIRLYGLGPKAAIFLLVAVLLLPLIGWLTYWVWGYFSLRYSLSRDRLEIRWAASRQIVPMAAITHVLGGRAYIDELRGFRWPGHEVGRAQTALDDGAVRDTLVFATTPPDGQLLIVVPDLAYAISPSDRAAFIEEFKMRRRLGPVQHVDHRTAQLAWASHALWRDWLALRVMTVAVLLNALAFAWLVWHYPTLPGEIALQFRFDPELGATVPGPLRPLADVWILPLIGLTSLAVNLVLGAIVHSRGRLAALLLAFGALLVQVAVGVVLLKFGA